MSSTIVCPKDCPERSAECHATCQSYREAWEANRKTAAEAARQRIVSDHVNQAVSRAYRTIKRKRPKF